MYALKVINSNFSEKLASTIINTLYLIFFIFNLIALKALKYKIYLVKQRLRQNLSVDFEET